jgi:hypothetical protein
MQTMVKCIGPATQVWKSSTLVILLYIQSCDLILKNILHVPTADKNLISVHQFTYDNHVFLELHQCHFLIKDQETKKILHHDKVERSLYPLKFSTRKKVLSSAKVSYERWHSLLGHRSPSILQRVLSNNNLPVVGKSSSDLVCDACQKGKMHQLPNPKSSSVSNFPLKLVFSDVWGSAPELVGRFKYYVSFITSLHGSNLLSINLRCFSALVIFKILLRGCLVENF